MTAKGNDAAGEILLNGKSLSPFSVRSSETTQLSVDLEALNIKLLTNAANVVTIKLSPDSQETVGLIEMVVK